jgi:hypothetical protein
MQESKPTEMVTVSKEELSRLLAQNAEYKEQERILIDCVFKSMQFLGIVDQNNKFDPQLKEKKNYFGHILKAVRKKISISDLLMGGSGAEAMLKENFGFLQSLKPLIDKHAGKYQ